mmetsp:Transcript_22657/g.55936  ORF Transcript_22657/g.55936 Transcript_22657/m.55936 type:complete len:217 (-) Transcript_22657:457-1107(-)
MRQRGRGGLRAGGRHGPFAPALRLRLGRPPLRARRARQRHARGREQRKQPGPLLGLAQQGRGELGGRHLVRYPGAPRARHAGVCELPRGEQGPRAAHGVDGRRNGRWRRHPAQPALLHRGGDGGRGGFERDVRIHRAGRRARWPEVLQQCAAAQPPRALHQLHPHEAVAHGLGKRAGQGRGVHVQVHGRLCNSARRQDLHPGGHGSHSGDLEDASG